MTNSALHDRLSCSLWSKDASIFEITPQAVFLPHTVTDILAAIEYARFKGLSVTARGGGTGTAGGCLTDGIVIDLSKNMRKIIAIDDLHKTVTVEAGATLEDINTALKPFGQMIGPDLSTYDRATIGGMIACNSAGSHSLAWGSIREHIEAVEVALSDGTVSWFDFVSLNESERMNNPYIAELLKVREEYGSIIAEETPPFMRRSSHLPLDELLYPTGIHAARLFAGSQGCLGIVTQARIKTVPLTAVKSSALLSFRSVQDALDSTALLTSMKLYGIELLDKSIVECGLMHISTPPSVKRYFSAEYTAYVLIESLLSESELDRLLKKTAPHRIYASTHILTDDEYTALLLVRKEGLSNLLSAHKGKIPAGFIEDLAVLADKASSFFPRVFKLLDAHNISYSVYGHMGTGCLHIRPFLHLDENGKLLMKKIMEEIIPIIREFNGAETGEHGLGIIRSWMSEKLHSKRYFQALKRVKEIFDPTHLMNKGKLFAPYTDFLTTIAPTPILPSSDKEPFFFRTHTPTSLLEHVSSCTGNGRCRKGDGLMCPPFQITRDERDSTRGRAKAVAEHLLRGRSEFTKEEAKQFDEILDLCIQCKGCISECPSHINMAKIKEEMIWKKRKKSSLKEFFFSIRKNTRSWIFGHIPYLVYPCIQWRALGSIASFIFHHRFFKWMSRQLLAIQSDGMNIKKRALQHNSERTPKDFTVIVFVDSLIQFFSPHTVDAALYVLDSLDEKPYLFTVSACGRSLFSKGYLEEGQKQAQSHIQSLLHLLDAQEARTPPILFLEPSSWSLVHDEWLDLPKVRLQDAQRIADHSHLIEEYIASRQREQLHKRLSQLSFSSPSMKAYYHPHCHQRALYEKERRSLYAITSMLEKIPFIQSISVNTQSSCCGMAGSFGMEAEHEKISGLIAQKTFTSLNNSKYDLVITNGLSCMHQTSKFWKLAGEGKILHPIECISYALQGKEP